MGCCSSSATAGEKDEPVSGKNTAPPPSVDEEETVVKEVLSETTLVTSMNETSAMQTTKNQIPEDEEKAADAAPDLVLTENSSVEPEKGSEICSLSESLLSIVNGYDEEEAKQRKMQGVRQRSPAKSRNRVMAHNYPTRRLTDMSPRKRNTEGGAAGTVRLVPSSSGQRDQTERSERRRSMSPATNRSVMMGPTGNHYSMDNGETVRNKGLSPARVRPNPHKNGSDQDCRHQWPSCGAAGGNNDSTPYDSFENPLVSLECFIFL